MAKTFYYSDSRLYTASIADGTISSTTFTPSDPPSSAVTNKNAINDENISLSVGAMEINESLRIDLGSALNPDFAAYYFKSSETADLQLASSASATESLANRVILTTTFSAGWYLHESDLGATNVRYWFLRCYADPNLDNLSEFMMGTKLEFEVNPDIGGKEEEQHGTDNLISYSGVEYSKKRHNPKTILTFNFSNISQTFKNNLQTMESVVGLEHKFLYSEDGTSGTFHYVKLADSMNFTEVAYQRYSTTIKLREQLA